MDDCRIKVHAIVNYELRFMELLCRGGTDTVLMSHCSTEWCEPRDREISNVLTPDVLWAFLSHPFPSVLSQRMQLCGL